MTRELFNQVIFAWIGFGAVIFTLLLFVSAPYGRHSRKGWGLVIPNKVGWVIMEFPSLLLFILFFLLADGKMTGLVWIFFTIWTLHYTNRSLIFPFRTKTKGKTMPVLITLFALFFNLINGSLNGYYFAMYANYTVEWLYDIRFILGSLIFLFGVITNFVSDWILLRLRKANSNGYQIPYGGLFKYVSCPNFFGEIMEWTGFAIMAWSPAALAFALWSFFNLVPRALAHHKWYKANFEDYPVERKALIPYIM